MLLLVLTGEDGYMYVNLNEILYKRSISLSYFARQIGCSYSNLWKFANNETNSISYDLLEKICVELNCGVEDILVVEKK